MSENEFNNIYKTFTTDRLLDIVDKSHDYQPLAVKAAQLELDCRQLTEEQMEAARTVQSTRQNTEAAKQQKVNAVEDKLKSAGSSVLDALIPAQNETQMQGTYKYIKTISLFLGLRFLYELYIDFGMLKFMFAYHEKWSFSMVLYFLPMILLPAAALLFWFRKKLGWTLAVLFFSFSAAGSIQLFFHELNRKPSGIPALDTLFPATSPAVYIISIFLYAGATWFISQRNIREVFNISKQAMYVTVGAGSVAVLLIPLVIGRN